MNGKLLLIAFAGIVIIVSGVYFLMHKNTAPASQTTNGSPTNSNPLGSPAASAPPPSAHTPLTLPDTPTAAQYAAPDQLAHGFYAWYLAKYGSAAMRDEVTTHVSDWLTPGFSARWQSLLDATEMDPFVLAQDALPADSNILASIISESSATSTVTVVVSSGTVSATYDLTLGKIGSQWRIDAIARR